MKLTRKEVTILTARIAAARAARTTLCDAIKRVNALIAELPVEAYCDALNDLTANVEDIAAFYRECIYDKSDQWRDGDAGALADAWVAQWEGVSLDEWWIRPDDIEAPADEQIDVIDSLPLSDAD